MYCHVLTKFVLIILVLALYFRAPAQSSQGVIYGAIALKNGQQYEGQIRWENRQALWDDVFEAPKIERATQNLANVPEARKKEEQQDDFKLGFMELWADKDPYITFPFRCSFGDIFSLEIKNDKQVLLTLKNGDQIKLKNGQGDLGDDLLIYDNHLGRLDLDLNEIRSINFKKTPTAFVSKMGSPVYGSILTTIGIFEGYIIWDMEERLGKDLISGRQQGVKIDIEFKDIAQLKTQGNGSLIELKSGKSVFLNDHDDVSRGNHGIGIKNPAFGTLFFDWKNFISADFAVPAKAPQQYDDFQRPQLLSGAVFTKIGARHSGELVYDLDEKYNIEFLNGENNGFEYYIPLKQVTRIEPQNDKFSTVYLKGGRQFLLGNNSDVNANNHGLILTPANGIAAYFAWKDIKRIELE